MSKLDEYKYEIVYEDRPLTMVKIPLDELKDLMLELIDGEIDLTQLREKVEAL